MSVFRQIPLERSGVSLNAFYSGNPRKDISSLGQSSRSHNPRLNTASSVSFFGRLVTCGTLAGLQFDC